MNRISKSKQYLLTALMVLISGACCYAFRSFISYRLVGFILLLAVSFLAIVFDILPVLFAAFLSALMWDFFFIPPYFTFQVNTQDDLIMLLMYFVIAFVNAVLTFKIRQIEKIARVKEERENTVKLYNTLLSSLSHELRTPIASIIGATDNLQTNNAKLSELNRNELIAEISKASFRLNQQVENLLNMSRLESGFIQPHKDWCDINEVVYDTVKRLEENHIRHRISININPEIALFKLDKGMLEQILFNLLNNAVQYSPDETTINITAAGYTDILSITVEDNGPGFPDNEIKKVFDKFYRLKNSRTGGTGLGLSIVKGFAEAMGGTVGLENNPTGGAKFTVEIAAEASYLKNLKNE